MTSAPPAATTPPPPTPEVAAVPDKSVPPPDRARPTGLAALAMPGVEGVQTLRTACLVVLATLALAAAASLLRDVLVPFVMALFLSLLVGPVTNALMKRFRWPRPLAVAATFVLGFVLVVLGLAALVPAAAQVAAVGDDYVVRTRGLIDRGLDALDVEDRDALGRRVSEGVMPYATTFARGLGSAAFKTLGDGLLVGVFLLFLLVGRGEAAVDPDSLRGQIERRVQAYLSVMLIVSALTGALVWLSLWVLGVPLAWLFGVLAFALNFVPNIGSAVATMLPLPFVVLDPEMGLAAKVLAFVLPAVVQFAVGNVLAPKMMGDLLGLSPVAVLLGLIFFGMIWGLPGLLLATPMLSVIQIALERVPTLAPLAATLGGTAKPGTSP